MRHLHRIAVLLSTTLTTLALTATAALAVPIEPPAGGESGQSPGGPAQPVVDTTVSSGLAGWQIALIAIGAALLGALATELVHVYRGHARHRPVTAM